jgi:ribosomal protein L11 methyltransferase
VRLQAYFPEEARVPITMVREKIQELHQFGVPVGPGEVRLFLLAGEDWAESWKRHFHVDFVTPNLQIVPTWEKAVEGKGDVLWIDPGMAFGLGDHPTTRGCLQMLERMRSVPSRSGVAIPTADVGSGTGILTIRAVQLGFGPVVAFDNEPEAVRCGRENAERNGVAEQIEFREGTMPARGVGPYERILANIFLSVLIRLLPRFARSLLDGGELLLAGITGDQEDRLRDGAELHGLRVIDRICERAQPGGRRWPILRLQKGTPGRPCRAN